MQTLPKARRGGRREEAPTTEIIGLYYEYGVRSPCRVVEMAYLPVGRLEGLRSRLGVDDRQALVSDAMSALLRNLDDVVPRPVRSAMAQSATWRGKTQCNEGTIRIVHHRPSSTIIDQRIKGSSLGRFEGRRNHVHADTWYQSVRIYNDRYISNINIERFLHLHLRTEGP